MTSLDHLDGYDDFLRGIQVCIQAAQLRAALSKRCEFIPLHLHIPCVLRHDHSARVAETLVRLGLPAEGQRAE